jgi:AraC-like DNA-binding protein
MSVYRHIPCLPLRQHVEWLWYYDDHHPDHEREHVLPDGTFDLIINLENRPRKLFDRNHAGRFSSFKRGWISGAHEEFLIIDALPASTMIGAHFRPGGAAKFLGLPASEIGRQVVEVDAIWGPAIWEWRDRLMEASGAQAKFSVLERMLQQRMVAANAKRRENNGVTWAIGQFVREPHLQSIAAVAHSLGVSHKQFIEQFRREAGLTPKLFCRIRRFQEVLGRIHAQKSVRWADVACSCGYFDQAHFVKDFVAFAGLNPSAYLDRRLEEDWNFVRADGAVER